MSQTVCQQRTSNASRHACREGVTRGRDLWVMLVLACAVALATLGVAAQPRLASGDEAVVSPGDDNTAVAVYSADSGVSTYAVSDHTVAGVTPSGTTINMFDYWVTTQGDTGAINSHDKGDESYAQNNSGINKDHVFKFIGHESVGVNVWTGAGNGPRSFVENTLVNGYPAIKAGEYNGVTYDETSLAYLFDSSAQEGKASYPNATGLLQQDDAGYYYYDCTKNFASLDTSTNSFTLYDAAAVKHGDSTYFGQFFPFNSASDVFTEHWNGLQDKGLKDDAEVLNHHFGMTMSTQFIQPSDGKVSYNGSTSDMEYSFSGDDDVWVYIDGVLVGDLGGIHDAAGLDINFHTGEVTITPAPVGVTANSGSSYVTTLKDLFEAAGKSTEGFAGDTFALGTQHTLNFFYLERGAWASNMSLKYNLYTQATSDIYKVDQNGNAIAGATFELHRADESYNAGDLIASGTTDANGQLVMTYVSDDARSHAGDPISFDEEAQNGCTHFVLRETGAPDGYSTPAEEMHLEYVQSKNTTSGTIGGSLISADENGISRQWTNGGYVSAKQTLVLTNQAAYDDNNKPLSSGTTFAVVLKLTGSDAGARGNWQAVAGDALDGYELISGSEVAGAITAAQAGSDCTAVFATGSTGQIQATIESLPGSIDEYAHMLADPSQGTYAVAVYHTTAPSIAGATTENTSYVNSGNFSRQFASTLYVPNVQNRLWVQKVDDAGNAVSGATFGLFTADAVTDNGDGTYTVNDGAVPYDTVTTADRDALYNLDGSACFPLDSDGQKPLVQGVYYLAELQAPDGYEKNETVTKVIVDSEGVWADAGKTGDGVLSMSGPGSLLASLSQFGVRPEFDGTLTNITGTLQSGELGADGDVAWSEPPSKAEGVKPAQTLNMHYGNSADTGSDAQRVLDYVGDDGRLPIIYADTGINRMLIK